MNVHIENNETVTISLYKYHFLTRKIEVLESENERLIKLVRQKIVYVEKEHWITGVFKYLLYFVCGLIFLILFSLLIGIRV